MESYENIVNKVVRVNNNIVSANGFSVGDYVVFDRSLGAYSDCIFRIDGYFEQNYLGHLRSYVEYDGGMSPIADFFVRGWRNATPKEISEYDS